MSGDLIEAFARSLARDLFVIARGNVYLCPRSPELPSELQRELQRDASASELRRFHHTYRNELQNLEAEATAQAKQRAKRVNGVRRG